MSGATGRVNLRWAFRIFDDHRAGRSVATRQIEVAQEAVFNVTGRTPGANFKYDNEDELRRKYVPR
ncbi:hypothetical protein [Paraburkholderia sediminicola]|uniref:hypothetical protein n=1 Tax=Paraburkholderia sediminicola TaxID=458836 RepID=UPI0038B84936